MAHHQFSGGTGAEPFINTVYVYVYVGAIRGYINV